MYNEKHRKHDRELERRGGSPWPEEGSRGEGGKGAMVESMVKVRKRLKSKVDERRKADEVRKG